LVVDDEDVVCRSYERVLTNAGFEVEKANNGKQALEHIAEHDYDVMFADLRMPGMDGLQVVRQLRMTHPKMPVVVITGYPSQDTLQEAARLGVTDYLTKPVAPDVLTQAATQAMTSPMWTDTAPYLATATLPTAGVAPRIITAQAVVPEAMLVEPAPAVAAAAAAEAVVEPAVKPQGVIGATFRLCGGLAVSLAYVMFLPLAGFAVLLGYGAKALFQKLVTKGV
jgi:CheY-like chemotaxis protein